MMKHPRFLLTSSLFVSLAALLLAFALPAPVFGERQPPDPLSGPPFVSAEAWAVYDWDTGELLGGENTNIRRSIASTTKIMTAWLAILEIDREPELLDQVVTFSERAGNTRGSSSRIGPDESVTLHDLLHGLMLPSGNDASVALAEFIGRRYLPEKQPGIIGDGDETELNQAAYAAFIEKMNSTARDLGMTDTGYMNPHGLDVNGHESTVADLAKLARHVTQHALFRKISGTRAHTGTVTTPEGETREADWRNTNQLLGIEGYHGVKTGTTRQAGACLVSIGHRGNDRLVVVVLGATSPAGRYVDSRNLYRWAWLERGHKPEER